MTPGDGEGLDEEVAQEAGAELESDGWPKEGRPAGNAERRDEGLADLEDPTHDELGAEQALGTRRSLGWPKEGSADGTVPEEGDLADLERGSPEKGTGHAMGGWPKEG